MSARMSASPAYYSQIFEFSCLPACLRMVLSAYDCAIPESYLRELSKCDVTGTTANNAVLAAQTLGFAESYSGNLEFSDLRQLLVDGIYPVVYVRLPNAESHAIVVTAIGSDSVTILDPADPGHVSIEKSKFETMWQYKNNLAIVLDPRRSLGKGFREIALEIDE